jgi:hypothetical protein
MEFTESEIWELRELVSSKKEKIGCEIEDAEWRLQRNLEDSEHYKDNLEMIKNINNWIKEVREIELPELYKMFTMLDGLDKKIDLLVDSLED